MDRLGISPIKIKGFKLEVTAYFAITPNTKQFGIGGQVKGELGSLTVEASLTIDALEILDEPYTHFHRDGEFGRLASSTRVTRWPA